MIQRPVAIRDVPLDEPCGPGPGIAHLPQRGMAPPPFPEPVRPVREGRLVIRLQQEADHVADELAGPVWDGRFILPLLSWRLWIFLLPGVYGLLLVEHG